MALLKTRPLGNNSFLDSQANVFSGENFFIALEICVTINAYHLKSTTTIRIVNTIYIAIRI